MQTKGRVAWQNSEIEKLHNIAGKYPLPSICRQLQRLQKKNGLPVRTDTAIMLKLRRLGYSKRPYLDNFPRDDLAKILDISRDRARSWCRNFGLEVDKGAQLTIVNLAKFRKWAYANPQCLAGIEESRLDWIMQDNEFSRRVSAMQRPRIGRRTPVVRLSDGKEFSSIKEAARQCYAHPSSIKRALNSGGTCAASKWDYKNELDRKAPAKFSDVS